jgi:hypothetical protein
MEVKYACSLGPLCHSAQILKSNNLKMRSYPFDWIFMHYNNIIHCLETDFNVFLDKSYYYINNSQFAVGHLKYYENMFLHHDPLNNIDHYNYYLRCVNRFRELLKKHEHKLFIMTFVNKEYNCQSDDFKKNIIEFNNNFSNYTSNYTLLIIVNYSNKETNSHAFKYNDNIHFLDLHTLSDSNGKDFINNIDNDYLNDLIKKTYKFAIAE